MAGEIQAQMLEESPAPSEPQDGTLPAGINPTAACARYVLPQGSILARNQKFESIPLQRGVTCEPRPGSGGYFRTTGTMTWSSLAIG
jgi:hypothetical protein